MKIYQYPNCGTCKKALKWLDASGVSYDSVDITENPPTKAEFEKMLAHYDGEIRRLFNTSGQLYREFKIKDKLPSMSDADAIDLLSQHGKLIKRPFLLTKDSGRVGFKEDEWQAALN